MTENKVYTLRKDSDTSTFDYIDQDGTCHNSPQEWLWSILGGCGCGSSEDFARDAWMLMEYFAKPHGERTLDLYEQPYLELMAQWFDSVRLIEHGTNIGGSWLSEKGEQVYEAIKALAPLP